VTVCPLAAWKPVGNHGGSMSAHLGLVLHVQQGNNSLAGWFNNPSADASSTFWVAKSGTLEQYVDADVTAWAQGSGNSTYNSVETEGYDTEPLTSAQEATLASLYQWGAQAYGWPNALAETPGVAGFGWHGMGGSSWGGHTGCPGDLRNPRRAPILAVAFGGSPAPTPPATTPTPPSGAAPAFPYPASDYLGQPSSDPHCHSGYYGGADQTNVATWQRQMVARGWSLSGGADGMYGPSSQSICQQFQQEKGLGVDGLVGPQTWSATWTAAVT
jgi:peptidoglycan hydrolase-like protein with peptidoglycan-binding domain